MVSTCGGGCGFISARCRGEDTIATQDCKMCAFSSELVIEAINHAVKDQSSLLCCFRVQRGMAAAARSHSVEQRQAGCRRPVVGGRWSRRWPNPAKKYK